MSYCFFISDHGFGHLMRNISVIKCLCNLGKKVFVVTGENLCNIGKTYCDKAIFIPYHTDPGLTVKAGSLNLDLANMRSNVQSYYKDFAKHKDFGKSIIIANDIDIVVVDIVPWALKSAEECKVKAFLMASFTWVEQYEKYIDPSYVNLLKDCYNSNQINLFYHLVNKPTRRLLRNGLEVGFVCRPINKNIVENIKNEHKGRKIVFISLGCSNKGFKDEIDVSNLNYDFITTPAIKLKGNNVYRLPENAIDTQNYINAADISIGKAGWTTISELMIYGGKFALIERSDVPEDTMLIEQLKKSNACISIKLEDLNNLEKVLFKIEKADLTMKRYENNVELIAKFLLGE